MKPNKSIQIKAAILLIVFSLNTVVGFACAVGFDMGFNSHHHEGSSEATVHVHSDGKKHIHHHDEIKKDHHLNDDKDNCCTDAVTKITQLDKAVPQPVKIIVHPVVSFLLPFFYDENIQYTSRFIKTIKHFVRQNHPPIADIRIAIRSFQI